MNRLDWPQRITYLLELRHSCDSALTRVDELEEAVGRWVELRSQLASDEETDHSAWSETLDLQGHVFDTLEAFLAIWARISLLLFPLDGPAADRAFRQTRGTSLREVLKLTSPEIIENRELWDSWMHFDERLDLFVRRGTPHTRQRFTTSHSVTELDEKSVLRLVEMDTLRVHFTKRDGEKEVADLRILKSALAELEQNLPEAFKRRLPSDSPA